MENYQAAALDYMAGMKYKDIAEKYGTTVNTVKSWGRRYGWAQKKGCKKGCIQNSKKGAEEISWVEIENEYVTDIRKSPCTLEELASKYDITTSSIERYSMEHKWSEKRGKYKESIKQKTIEKSADRDVDRITRLLEIADAAADKAEQALGELETYVVHNKTKKKTVEYKDHEAKGKPTKEVIEETEKIERVQGPVDRLGLSQVTAALRNIKELYGLPLEMEDKRYKAEYDKKRAEVKDNTGEEILRNMQTIAEILQNPVANRVIEDFEGEAEDESASAIQ